ncbi:MAG: type 1 glutamine amidotransferase [Sandaracinaceae bacterium]
MTRSPKVLLLQVRNAGDAMRAHEAACFVERTELPPECVVAMDVVDRSPSMSEVRAHDAVMIGGAGEYYVSKRNQPGLERLYELLRELATVGHPTFATCYGFQCMVEAYGGSIVHDPARTEVGTYRMALSDAGRRDPLLGQLPAEFLAQQGHKDRADALPDGFDNLAASEQVSLQALRVPGKPVWGVQFHPELDHRANRHRYEHYLDAYSAHMSAEEREAALARFQPTPESSGLLRRFLDLL